MLYSVCCSLSSKQVCPASAFPHIPSSNNYRKKESGKIMMLSQRGHVTFIHAGVTKFTVRCRHVLLLKTRLSGFHTKHTSHVCPGKMDLLQPNTQHIQHRQLNLFKIFTQPLTHNSLLTVLRHVTGWVFMCSEPCPRCSSSSW